MYATALGVYEAFVNGVRAGTAELSPGSTSYTATLYAQASDVTAALADGENTLEVVLSDGWFRGLTGAHREPATWGTRTAARLELYLRYTDGSTQVVRSGPGWTSSTGPIRRADRMDGQTTDFTAAPSPATPVLVDAVTAPPIEWTPAPPVRRVAQLPARTVRTLDTGAYVVDFDRDEVISDGVPGRAFEPRHTTAARLYDVAGFTDKWLRSVRDDQLDDGRICNISPDAKRLKVNREPLSDLLTGSAGWGDAIVLVTWVMYETYGDRRVLTENWDAMVRWVEFALHSARSARHPSRVERSPEPEEHEAFLWDGSFHWGEWLEPRPRNADGTQAAPVWEDGAAWFGADKSEVATAYLYRSTRTLSAIADLLDRPEDATRYREVAERVRDAWRREFLDDAGRTTGHTQAGYVRALSFALIPDALWDRAAQHLVATLVFPGGHTVRTGPGHVTERRPVFVPHG
ncbi:alpha-L-rhamnosidase-related protein [Cryptosporangium minutisporangium]|uniref:alpha-L-rhamnosidase n=1 Tax=Cryptosporangium minutisporangium TaxID=113569 RepID=A0ABP6SSZ2_9ACTN